MSTLRGTASTSVRRWSARTRSPSTSCAATTGSPSRRRCREYPAVPLSTHQYRPVLTSTAGFSEAPQRAPSPLGAGRLMCSRSHGSLTRFSKYSQGCCEYSQGYCIQGFCEYSQGYVSTHNAVLAQIPPVGQHCIFLFAGVLALHPYVYI